MHQHLLAQIAHLAQDQFEFSVIGNRLLIKHGLLFGQSDRDGLGLNLSSPTPGIGRLRHHAALTNPLQFEQLAFEVVVFSLDLLELGGR